MTTEKSFSLNTWLTIGLFFIVCFAVYHQSLWYPFVRWDDGLLIYDNPAIRAITPQTLWKIFTSYDPELYIPLTFFSYQLNYLIGGTSPTIYNLTNLLFHTANALLVCWFFRLLGFRTLIAMFCGLLFAVHPLNTEAVVWASARKDVLSIFFGLLSLNLYLRFSAEGLRKWYVLSLFCFVLGLFSKVIIAVLPAILCLILWQKRSLTKQKLFQLLPFFGLSILFIIIALLGKQDVISSATTSQTLLMATKSTVFYLQKFAFPTQLSVLYPYTDTIALRNPEFIFSAVSVLIVVALGVYALWKRWQVGTALGIFFVALLPTFSNFSKGGDFYFASDRYAYLALVGLLWLLALGLQQLATQEKIHKIIMSACVCILCVCVYLSHSQAKVWSDTESLFRHAVGLYPNSHIAHSNIGNMYSRAGDFEAAIASYNEALHIRNHHRTRSNLANVYRKQRLYAQAEAEYNRVLQETPNAKEALFGMGVLAAEQGKTDTAISLYARALEQDPTYVEVHINFGALYMQTGDIEAAIEQFDQALAIIPYSPEAHYNRAAALRTLKRTKEAIVAYENAVSAELRFVAARINLALLYHERGRTEEAIEQFEAVLQYDPNNARALSALQQLGIRN